MASMFLSILDRTLKLPALLAQRLSRSTSASSSSSAGRSQVEKDLGKLGRRMKRIEALLSDAEEKEIKEKGVKLWLDELRNVICQGEDVLGEVEYKLLRYRLDCDQEEEDNASLSSHDEARRGMKRKLEAQVSTSHSTPARCPPLDDPSFQQQIVGEIKEIYDLFDEIYRDGLALKLEEGDGQRRSGSDLLEPPTGMPTSCLVDEQGVHGRDDDKKKVMDMLLSADHHEKVGVVSIVGMGGLGKTTLAKLIYNDRQVIHHFKLRMWVCVSEPFDVVQLTKKILDAALGQGSSEVIQEFSFLQESLLKVLQGKRFLLVLDDVWNESQSRWDALRVPLLGGAQGSRVLITTRSEVVSRISLVDPANMHRLGCLSEDDCWSLFEQRAFGGRSSVDYPELVPIGKEIVQRCKGVPLTVKTLAGHLFCEFRKDRWTDILRSELWELPEGKDDILPALKLSYHHLPSHLKPCFAYCAVFPKDHRFGGDDLVRMWMGHGYIKPSAKKCVEDVGRGYLEDLLQRSLIQKTKDQFSGVEGLVMHDLIHDLALSFYGREFCQVVQGRLSNAEARHLIFTPGEDLAGLLSHEPIDNLKRLRTCYSLHVHHCLEAVDAIFVSMKYLRVLHLFLLSGNELSDSVGNLTHLRYLSIIRSSITVLPESLGDLLNLQTLNIGGLLYLKALPRRLKDLVNLRHLCIDECPGLRGMPRGIGRLTQLQTLPLFVVGEGSDSAGIEELAGLNDLRGNLKIVVKSLNNWVKGCHGGGGHGNYEEEACILRNKPGLDSLTLLFEDTSDDMESPQQQLFEDTSDDMASPQQQLFEDTSDDMASPQQQQQQEELFECLRPHTNVTVLNMVNYIGGRFPEWMRDASSSGLERISLCGRDSIFSYLPVVGSLCGRDSIFSYLPVVGQLSWVKFLEVSSMDATTSMVCGFLTGVSFPSLEECILGKLNKCEGMTVGTEGGDKFPRLRRLKIFDCSELEYVKLRYLMALEKLEIFDCYSLTQMDYSYDDDDDDESISQSARGNCTHIPGVHTIRLSNCPELNFPAQQLHTGQLFWVKFLELSDIAATTDMVCEFLTGVSFPSLEEFILADLRKCEGMTVGAEGGDKFPRLRLLKIIYCSELEYVKLRHLTALEKLEISDCAKLTQMDYSYDDDDDDESISQSARGNCTHIPGLHTIRLSNCPKLNFPVQEQSTRVLEVNGCPLMREWVRCHSDKLVGITCIIWDDTLSRPFLSLSNVQQVGDDVQCSLGRAIEFELQWDDVEELWSSSSPAGAEQVLSELRPSENVQELIIRGYRGRSFPNWFEDLGHFDSLKTMTLSSCIHWDCLPPLGQLPALEQLYISSMPGIRRVGSEFCSSRSGVAFQSLHTLEFRGMPQWEEWREVEDGAFPVLNFFRIYNCPNLRSLELPLPLLLKLVSDTVYWSDVLDRESDALNGNGEPYTTVDLSLRLWPSLP